MDLKSLYQEILNEHNLNPTHKGVMENPTFTLQGVNPSCGDNIYLQLKIDDNGVISEGSFNRVRDKNKWVLLFCRSQWGCGTHVCKEQWVYRTKRFCFQNSETTPRD